HGPPAGLPPQGHPQPLSRSLPPTCRSTGTRTATGKHQPRSVRRWLGTASQRDRRGQRPVGADAEPVLARPSLVADPPPSRSGNPRNWGSRGDARGQRAAHPPARRAAGGSPAGPDPPRTLGRIVSPPPRDASARRIFAKKKRIRAGFSLSFR